MYLDSPPDALIEEYDQRYKNRHSRAREWKGECKEDFLNRLHFPIFEDNIEYIAFLFDGGKGRGKSKKMERTAEILIERFEEEDSTWNLIPVRSTSIAHKYFADADYNLVLIDDPTVYDKKLTKEAVDNFNRMRHIFKLIRKSGVLIIMWTVQDAYQLGKILRKDTSGTVYVDWPSDEFDQNQVRRNCHPQAEPLLKTWTTKIRDEHKIEFKGRCIITTESWTGYANFELPKTERFQDFEKQYIEPEKDETISLSNFDSEGIDFSYPVFDKVDVTDLITLALDQRKEIMQQLKINSPRLEDRKFKAFRSHYIDGVTLDNLAEQFGLKGSSNFTNSAKSGGWFAHIRQEYLGHALEYLLTQPGQIYEGYKRIAGNLHIDLLKDDIGIEVKTRHRPNDSPSDDWLSTHTIKQLLELDYSCNKGCKKLKQIFIFRVITNRTTGLIAYIHRVVNKERDAT